MAEEYLNAGQTSGRCRSFEPWPVWVAVFLLILPLFPAFVFGRSPVLSLKEIRERGVVMQQWETSCAAASVATVLTYGFRDPVSEYYVVMGMLAGTEPELVKQRGGFSLLDMKRFVENRGYEAQAFKYLSVEDLQLFHAPIVPITQHGRNHYVVFNGVRGRHVILADPAFGNRRMRIGRFMDAWVDGLAFVIDRTRKEEKP